MASSVGAGGGTRPGTALPGPRWLLFQPWRPARKLGAGCQRAAQQPAAAAVVGCGAGRSELGGRERRAR